MKKVNTKCREMEIERDDGDVSVCMLNLGKKNGKTLMKNENSSEHVLENLNINKING